MFTTAPSPSKVLFALLFSLGSFLYGFSQPTYNANSYVPPYDDEFLYGFNMGSFQPNWSDKTLADIAAGNPALGVEGIGVNTIRPKIPHNMLDKYGDGILLDAFQHYAFLGMKNFTGYIGYPAPSQQDPKKYNGCNDQSKLFKNLYEPIWDGGKNGTPVNDNNPYALYVYNAVTTYKDYVKFWEIMNEPDLDYTGSGYKSSGEPNNWWDNNPPPCDLHNVKAPVFHYIRTLRISYEVIKSVDPSAFVTVGGLGYPSFLDALLRNTDNPDAGKVTGLYPLKGGAYFDVLNFHHYPHHGLRVWNNDIKNFVYSRHSDAATESLLTKKESLNDVLKNYGYDGVVYPEKRWLLTESNVPRKKIGGDILAGDDVQVNFIIKALVTVQKADIDQFHIYNLGDTKDWNEATDVYQLMGMYKNLHKAKPYAQQLNDLGIAYKTTVEILKGLRYDAARTSLLGLNEKINGAAFKDSNGKYTYVLWAKTKVDNSEHALAEYSFPASLGVGELNRADWEYGVSKTKTKVSPSKISLTATPIFLSDLNIATKDEINLTAEALSHSEIKLSWHVNFNTATAYKIERSLDSITKFKEIASVSKATSSFIDDELTEETKYFYRIRAALPSGYSDYSNEIFAFTEEGPLPAPSDLTATAVNEKHIKLSWKDNSSGEFSFTVERSINDNADFEQIAVVGSNATFYNSYGLAPGTTYFYRVKATGARGDSNYSNEATAKTAGSGGSDPGSGGGSMDAPSELEAKAVSASHVKISWKDNSTGEFSFKIERSVGNNNSFAEIAIAGANASYYNDYGLSSGTKYFYRVKAVNNIEESDYSNISKATTPGNGGVKDDMAAPSNLTSEAISNSQIKITWVDNSTKEFSFIIERSVGNSTNFREIAVAGANATQYNDYGLSPGKSYFYRVKAVNNREESEFSNITSAKTNGEVPVGNMNAPSDLSATIYFNAHVTLSWKDNSTGEYSFRIERSAWNASNFEEVAVAGANATSYVDYGLDKNIRYFYRVRAVNARESSSYSNIATVVTPIDYATDPTLAHADDNSGKATSTARIYPNPASQTFFVEIENEYSGPVIVSVLNAYLTEVGSLIFKKSGFSQKTTVPISGYGSGLYYVEVVYGKSRTVQKLIIE